MCPAEIWTYTRSFDRSLENDRLMAKREVLRCKANVRTEQEAYEADKQLDHPGRLGALIAPSTKRKSLYNQQYGVFARDRHYVAGIPRAVRRTIGLLPLTGCLMCSAEFWTHTRA